MSLWTLILVGLAFISAGLASVLDDIWRAQRYPRPSKPSPRLPRRYQNQKLIRDDANGGLQLCSLRDELTEQTSLAPSYQATAGALNTRLGDLMKLSGVSH